MRATWTGELRAWTDSVGVSVRATWLLAEPEEAVAGFYEGYDFGGIGLARLEKRDGRRFLWQLGLRGTPTTYVLDRQGRYRFTVPGNQLPPADSMRSICR